MPVRDQAGVHPVLERRALPDQMQTETGPLALAPHAGIGEPDRRHQFAAGQLGQHPGIDTVGLTGQGRQPLHPLRVRDLHLPARQLQLVVHETGAVHRLHHRHHLAVKPAKHETSLASPSRSAATAPRSANSPSGQRA